MLVNLLLVSLTTHQPDLSSRATLRVGLGPTAHFSTQLHESHLLAHQAVCDTGQGGMTGRLWMDTHALSNQHTAALFACCRPMASKPASPRYEFTPTPVCRNPLSATPRRKGPVRMLTPRKPAETRPIHPPTRPADPYDQMDASGRQCLSEDGERRVSASAAGHYADASEYTIDAHIASDAIIDMTAIARRRPHRRRRFGARHKLLARLASATLDTPPQRHADPASFSLDQTRVPHGCS